MTSPISSTGAMIRLQKSVSFHNITCAMLKPLFVFFVYFISNNRRERSFLFFVDETTPKPISIANETRPTCASNPHCLHQLVCTGASAANRHPCFAFLLNLSSISSLFSLRSIPKKMSYVLLFLSMYKFSLLRGKPLSKRHIIVVAGLSASDLLGFLASLQCLPWLSLPFTKFSGSFSWLFLSRTNHLLQSTGFHWSANTVFSPIQRVS